MPKPDTINSASLPNWVHPETTNRISPNDTPTGKHNMQTPAKFSKTWNETAARIGCPVRAEFAKRGMKAFIFRGQESNGHEIWWPIRVEQFYEIASRFPELEALKP
jgi:hypothetical protein